MKGISSLSHVTGKELTSETGEFRALATDEKFLNSVIAKEEHSQMASILLGLIISIRLPGGHSLS